MAIKELDFSESIAFAEEHKTRLVWLGREPLDYICGLLELSESRMMELSPNEVMEFDKKKAETFKDHIFVCSHGNTSRVVANMLKDRFGIESISMKGGVTAIVGEIF